nr:replication-relaxation family protein [Streptomyces microflavus]
MGGTARDAAKAGAPHALAVTDTIDAFCSPHRSRRSPLPAAPPGARSGAGAVGPPCGSGAVARVGDGGALPVSGTFTTPARGSLRADAVLTAPEAGVPVLFVEVDNHTEPDAVVAWKIESYRRFFQRTTKDHRGRDVPFWRTLWDPSGRDGHPPLALVFAKDGVSPEARMNRMKKIRDLSTACWQGVWHSGSVYDDTVKAGYRDYTGTIPVLATTLAQLRLHGPTGRLVALRTPRVGNPPGRPGQPEDHRAYRHREEQRRTEHAAKEEREHQERQEAESRRKAAAWPCPTCGRKVFPDDGETRPPGSECTVCTSIKRREQEEAAASAAEDAEGQEEAKRNGLFGFLH